MNKRRGWLVAGTAVVMVVVALTLVNASFDGAGIRAGERVLGMSASTAPTAVAPPPGRAERAVGPASPGWSATPLLGDAPGERYVGRIVVELGGGVVFMPSQTQAMIQRAVTVLDAGRSFPVASFALAGEPVLDRSLAARGEYRGAVIVELWDRTTNVAVAPGASAAESSAREAVAILRSFR